MKIIKLNVKNKKEVIESAVKVLEAGGLLIYPTETCYGAGVLATDEKAVNKLLKYKKRPFGKAISIAVSSKNMAERYVKLNETAENIYNKFLPGPFTVISNSRNKVQKLLESEKNTLGIRIPAYDLVIEIIKKINKPISATSANSNNKKTPYSISDILNNISNKQKKIIDLVIDAGTLPKRPPSTIIDTTFDEMKIIRKGLVFPLKQIYSSTSEDESEMKNIGKKLIKDNLKLLKDKCIFILFNADLGAGKTQFVKGIGQGLEINENINSPTYSLIKEYDFKTDLIEGKLVHFDAWRLENLLELRELGIENYFKAGNVVAVEWAGALFPFFQKFQSKKNVKIFEIEILYKSLDKRLIKIYS